MTSLLLSMGRWWIVGGLRVVEPLDAAGIGRLEYPFNFGEDLVVTRDSVPKIRRSRFSCHGKKRPKLTPPIYADDNKDIGGLPTTRTSDNKDMGGKHFRVPEWQPCAIVAAD